MYEDTTVVDAIRTEIHLSLDELARRGAQRMLEAALQAEVDEYVQRHQRERDEAGRAQGVRTGEREYPSRSQTAERTAKLFRDSAVNRQWTCIILAGTETGEEGVPRSF